MIASTFTASPGLSQSIIDYLVDKYGKQKGTLIYQISDDEILVATETFNDYFKIKEDLFNLVSFESKGDWNISTKELK